MDDTTERTPIEDHFYDSNEEEDYPFNSLSTCVFYGRTSPFVSRGINEMVPMNKNSWLTHTHTPIILFHRSLTLPLKRLILPLEDP